MAISPAAGTRLSASGLSTQARYWRNKSTRKKIAPNRCRRVLDGLSRKNGLPLGGSIAPNQGPFCRLRSVFLLNRGFEFPPYRWGWILRELPMFDRTTFLGVLAGAVGGAIAIAKMEAFSIREEFPLWAIPFATSIVTVLGSPTAKPAQPRALIGGHLISTIIGLVMVKIVGPNPWAAAVAVGLSMTAMRVSGTFHPPA